MAHLPTHLPSPHSPALPLPLVPARLDFLDGLRGLAALGVLIHHYSAAFYPTTMTGDPATAHLPGHWETWLAASPVLLNFRLSLFFALSGLVLAASVARAPRGWRPLLPQLARRYVRLSLPVAASLVLAYALLLTHSFRPQVLVANGATWLEPFWQWLPSFGQFVRDALGGVMMRNIPRYNPVLWTMMVEWQGSLLVLGVLALAGTDPWRLALYAGLALAFMAAQADPYYVAFLLGLSLHDVYHRQWHRRLAASTRRVLVVGLLLATAFLASYPESAYQFSVTGAAYTWLQLPGVEGSRAADFYHILGSGTLLAALLLSGRLQKIATTSLLRRLGKRAFALYLLHFLLMGSGSAWLFGWLRGHFAYNASFGLMALLSGGTLVVLTEVFYRLIDNPSHAVARWVGRVSAAALAYLLARRSR
ncbi:acyltransferase family protein [Hymenobacter sp. HMF4947]|uniref:Acyltransferase family protein n=1 Tax=Hymenobacter ginkgonis TaxID=2682976 RepID=A0A7K1TGW1_9BACT|nr:acyltransferase [Hymenobacter ginkgonis]MVN77624.1 acyltransferase family protein [Hymenobacter ginkgonis]